MTTYMLFTYTVFYILHFVQLHLHTLIYTFFFTLTWILCSVVTFPRFTYFYADMVMDSPPTVGTFFFPLQFTCRWFIPHGTVGYLDWDYVVLGGGWLFPMVDPHTDTHHTPVRYTVFTGSGLIALLVITILPHSLVSVGSYPPLVDFVTHLHGCIPTPTVRCHIYT